MEIEDNEIHINFDDNENVEFSQIIIVDQIVGNFCNQVKDIVNINNTVYKLTTIIGTRTTGFCHKWNGNVFSRNCGS